MGKGISDPVVIGPGTWGVMHSLARKYTSVQEQKFVKEMIEKIIKNFPCMECRDHAMDYLAKNPINLDGEKMTVFIWTVDFHNFVNTRLHKDYIDIQDALDLWSGENVCFEDCGGEPIVMDVKTKKSIYKVY